jgi:co-chaperonin GroES (HSP10)
MLNIKFKPIGLYILVEPDPEEKTLSSGLIVAKNQFEATKSGVVVKTSDDYSHLKEGVRVYWKYPPSDIVIDNKKYLIINVKDLLGYEEQVNKEINLVASFSPIERY